MLDDTDWDIRLFVYREFASSGIPPTVDAISQRFDMSVSDAKGALQRLHVSHALFLRPGSQEILMANPLSAVATDYQVAVGERLLFANCAWDSLGIPAMLGEDAIIDLRHPLNRELVQFSVKKTKLVPGDGGIVHFAKPFRNWYDNLIDT